MKYKTKFNAAFQHSFKVLSRWKTYLWWESPRIVTKKITQAMFFISSTFFSKEFFLPLFIGNFSQLEKLSFKPFQFCFFSETWAKFLIKKFGLLVVKKGKKQWSRTWMAMVDELTAYRFSNMASTFCTTWNRSEKDKTSTIKHQEIRSNI